MGFSLTKYVFTLVYTSLLPCNLTTDNNDHYELLNSLMKNLKDSKKVVIINSKEVSLVIQKLNIKTADTKYIFPSNFFY